MQKSKKILIILIILFAIIISTLLILLNRVNNLNNNTLNSDINKEHINNNNINIDISEDIKTEEINIVNKDTNRQINSVTSNVDYFTIKDLYIKYINLIGSRDTISVQNILSNIYKEKYKITDENIFNKLVVPQLTNEFEYYKYEITEMLKSKIHNNTYVYIIKGRCRIVNKENSQFDINIMIELDEFDNTYIIYPEEYLIDKGFNNLKIGDSIDYQKEEITINTNNKFTYVTKNDSDVANEYFSNLKELLLYYPDEAYNRLDKEYAKKRFGSKKGFINYIGENRTTIALMSLYKYKIVSKEEYVDYICSDKYDNIYILRQKDGIMNYTIFLDNYTIMRDEDIEYYNKLDKYDKATYNLSKFIEMVNTKDYNSIYQVLDSTFKSNNFTNIEKLKEYLKINMYEINNIEINDYDNDTYEYCIFYCKITNKKNKTESKDMTIIINQNEGTEFTMSFSVNEE